VSEQDGSDRSADEGGSPWFLPVIFLGGLIFGAGLAVSRMVRPEVVLSFLRLSDLGLLFVMGGASVVVGVAVFGATHVLDRAPLTGTRYGRRLKSLDRNVVVGGVVFGAGWGLSGICPGAGYASLGVGNYPILWGIAGMFVGAYAQGYWRSRSDVGAGSPTASD
jgi:uncharacterized membrane protein YedE/YeeE